ncbi:LysM peptidoglycan-binding domain-containing protein [Myceligenerans crystallogenes]|uniref:LysM domain-containing protein n=1 Tax=Myceligenerans crystallogenes TaxID=316335 RepID=A0ABN2ND51_9MICO
MSTSTERKATAPSATSSGGAPGTGAADASGSTAGRILRGLSAALLLVVLVVGIPIGLWTFGVMPLGGDLSWEKFLSVMSAPDVTGEVFLSLMTVVGWLAWATFAVAVVVELVSALRGVRAPHLAGLGLQQRVAAALVGAVVAMALSTPGAGEAAAAGQAVDPVDGQGTDPAATSVLESVPGGAASPGATASPAGGSSSAPTSPGTPDGTTTSPDGERRGTPATGRSGPAGAGGGPSGTATTTSAGADTRGSALTGNSTAGSAEAGAESGASRSTRTRADAKADRVRQAASDTNKSYDVMPGDSLWRIAQATLGDGTRFKEIAHLNYGVPQPDGQSLDGSHWVRPGWVLTLPDDASGPGVVERAAADVAAPGGPEHDVTVVPGDTLWEIAEDELGDGTRYPELYEATKSTTQPDGRRLTDPDLIHPGWEVTVPGAEAPSAGDQGSDDAAGSRPAPGGDGKESGAPGGDAGDDDAAGAEAPGGESPAEPGNDASGTAAPDDTATDVPTEAPAEAPSEVPSAEPTGSGDEPSAGPSDEPASGGTPPGDAVEDTPDGGPSDELPAEQPGDRAPERTAGDRVEKDADPAPAEPAQPPAEEQSAPITRGAQRAEKPESDTPAGTATEAPDDTPAPGTPLDPVEESDTQTPDIDESAPPAIDGGGPATDGGSSGPSMPDDPTESADAPTGSYQEVGPADLADEGTATEAAEEVPAGGAASAEGAVSAEGAARPDAVVPGTPTAEPTAPAVSAALTDADLSDELLEAFDVRTAAGIGGLLAAGILALLAGRRDRARRRRKPGERIGMPDPGSPSALLETDLRAVADELGRAQVDIALRTLAGWHRERGLALPGVRVARLKAGEFVELYLDRAAELPAPWISTTDRYVWQLPAGENPAVASDRATPELMESPYPSLVTLGHDDENAHLMVDLENIGCLDIRGTDEDAQATLAALAVELATSLWADDLQVTVVGALSELPGVCNTGRIRHVPSVAGIVRELEARAADVDRTLAQVGAANLAEARGRGLAMDAWTPEILLVGEALAGAERSRLESLVERVPGVGIAAVTSRAEIGEWMLDLTGELTGGDTSRGVLVPAYIAVRPQQLDAETYLQALELLGDPEPVAGPEWARNIPAAEPELIEPALLPDFNQISGTSTTTQAVEAGDVVEAPLGEKVAVEVGAGVGGPAALRAPSGSAGASVDLVGEPTTAPAPGGPAGPAGPGAPGSPGGGRGWDDEGSNPWVVALDEGSSGDGPGSDPALAAVVDEALEAPEEPQPAATPVVRVLGTVELAGCAGVELPASHQRQAMELVAYLAFNPGARGSDISRALWPSRDPNLATRRSAVSRARRWLGTDAYGFEYLPRYWSTDDGSQVDQEKAGYRLRGVTTDWDQFNELVGPDITTTPLADLRRALELVRGVPFQDTPARKYVWAEVLMQDMAAGVVDVAHEVSRRALAEGDLATAREASRVGRIADPADERSWRNSIRTEYASGRMDAAGRLIDRLRDHLEQLDMEPEPETEDLINEIDAANRHRS